MLTLDDPRWQSLDGGYRLRYDPTATLRRLATDWADAAAGEELSGELHHQGDVGTASYAAIPALVDLARLCRGACLGRQCYGLVATIESERHRRANPPLPEWLAAEYVQAWSALLGLALDELRTATDPLVVRTALAVVVIAKGSGASASSSSIWATPS